MPVDTQHLGSVHGGVLLSLMEEAGDLHCTRYCNQLRSYDKAGQLIHPVAVLGHVEKTVFMHAIKLGDLMQIETEVVFTSLRSVRAFVNVYALNFKGRRLACQSVFWYVPMDSKDHTNILSVPALHHTDPKLYENGCQMYKKFREQRAKTDEQSLTMTTTELIGYSDYVVQPVHCGQHSYCKGGHMMKWIDECAGRDAVIHCRQPVVTASIENMRFYSPVHIGGFVSVVSKPVFASKRTIDMYSVAYLQRFDAGNTETVVYQKVADGILTFAAFNKDKSADDVTLTEVFPETAEEKRLYEERQRIYLERKSKTAKQ
jgi:acyl-coenzyme A thioesterase 7